MHFHIEYNQILFDNVQQNMVTLDYTYKHVRNLKVNL